MKKVISFMLAFLMVFTAISSTTAFAQEKVLSKEEQIANNIEFESDLEESLDFILENAIIRDASGNVTNFDFELIEEKYGKSADLDAFKLEIQQDQIECGIEEPEMDMLLNPNGEFEDLNVQRTKKCFYGKIKKNFVEVTSVSAMASIYTAVKQARYRVAAQKIIKAGAKGNIVTLSFQLLYYYTGCVSNP